MNMKDWTGTEQFIASCNNRKIDAEQYDYYATEPRAVELLLQNETFNHSVWECACGAGHISKVLSDAGYDVKSSDIIDRGYPETEIIDFLQSDESSRGGGDLQVILLLTRRINTQKSSLRRLLKLLKTRQKLRCF